VIHELSEDGSAEIHATFSAKAALAWQPGFGFKSAWKISNRKIQVRP